MDHVNLIDEFGHPFAPYTWQFHGAEKRARKLDPTIRLRLCPETFIYCEKPSCVGCESNTTKRKTRAEAIVDVQLRELAPPVALNVRPPEEQEVFGERLEAAMDRARAALGRGEIDSGAIGELLALSHQVDRQPMTVYWALCSKMKTVCVPLLSEIARIKKYHPYWTKHKRDEIHARLEAAKRRAG
jgi:hypothetical protein